MHSKTMVLTNCAIILSYTPVLNSSRTGSYGILPDIQDMPYMQVVYRGIARRNISKEQVRGDHLLCSFETNGELRGVNHEC
jgi:hypothetical protein